MNPKTLTPIAIAALLMTTTMNASERPLAERRVIDKLMNETIPAQEAKLEELMGRKIPITVEVDSFPPGTAGFEWLESRGFPTILDGLPKVASDRLGKEALEVKVTAVHFVYDKDIETVDRAVSFKDKTLVLSFYWDGSLMLDGDLLSEELGNRF